MRKRWKVAAAAALAITLVAAGALLPVGDWARVLVDRVRGAGAGGIAAFAAVYLVAPLLLLPASVLTLGAGFLYGPLWGTVFASPVSVGAASLAFLLGRTLARRAVERRIEGDARFAAIDRAVGELGFKIVFLLRLSPVVPFNLLNYALGLTRVRFATYLVASFLGMLPGTFLYVSLGSAATSAAQLARGHGGAGTRVAFWVGIAATIAAVLVVARVARNALRRALSEEHA
jgi:uncharacterized membrane protein YdjX (TVP38/TMEM64 family)